MNLSSLVRFLLLGLVLAAFSLDGSLQAQDAGKDGTEPSAEAVRFFETKIRPVLAESCYRCHGEKKQKGNLRLDDRHAIMTGGDNGAAIVVGDPDKSRLIKAVRQTDPTVDKMPPTGKLTREQLDDLAAWVKMGAPWPGASKGPVVAAKKGEREVTDKDREHWSYKPVVRPAVPKVTHEAWVANPIDAFIAAKLEAKGLEPNPAATKTEQVRRLYYNITGLPPTPAEVAAFVNDASPKAYETLAAKLLSSPHFGEKWARHWLDVVRYGETNSYERDNPKPHVWRYRDYVIRAFNDDKPYNDFLREQLAGDEMPNPGADQIIATGFYRLGIWDDEPSDRQQARFDGLDDIVATVGQGILGMTMDCARCHDHKIDPIPQKDYYRLLSFFHNVTHYRNNGDQVEIPISAPPSAKELADYADKRNGLIRQLIDIEQQFAKLAAGKIKAADPSPIRDLKYRYYRSAWTKLPAFDDVKHEDAGSLPHGLFDLSPRSRDEDFGFVFEGNLWVPTSGSYVFTLDSDDGSRLIINGKTVLENDGVHLLGKERSATVELAAGLTPIRLEYFQAQQKFGLNVTWSGPGFKQQSLSSATHGKDASEGFAAQFKKHADAILGAKRVQEYDAIQKQLAALKPPTGPGGQRALGVTESGSKAPDTFVLMRGNPGSPGAKVAPAFPTVLSATPPAIVEKSKSSGRRTALAKWITSRDNQLTARVIVNRLWQHHFGRGIVRSPNNFGFQGDRPTHPELLDWLAVELMDNGWSLRHIHTLIVNSNAYKMSSRGNAAGLKIDPANDLFWRFDMRRLGAEEIRDSILAVSGNLNPKMFGPGVYPEIPKEVMAGQSVPGRGWGKSPPDEQARRSIYVHVKRSLLVPVLESFDLAETDRSAPTRFSSTQPTQALLMLNSAFINQQAEIFANRLRREAGDDLKAQVRLGLNLATSRPPTDGEIARGIELVTSLTRDDRASQQEALRFFCLMALNLNEFMYLD